MECTKMGLVWYIYGHTVYLATVKRIAANMTLQLRASVFGVCKNCIFMKPYVYPDTLAPQEM